MEVIFIDQRRRHIRQYQAGPVPRRVLFLVFDMLWPGVGGGRIRCAKLLLRALDEIRIDLVVVAPRASVDRDLAAVPCLPGLTTHIFADESSPGPAPTRASRTAADLMSHLASNGDGYDTVHVEGHYLLPLVPPELLPRTVVVEHNIESQLLQQCAAMGKAVPQEAVAALRDSEQAAWRRAGAVIALSPEDAAEMRSREPAVKPYLIPNGWDHLPAPAVRPVHYDSPLTTPRLLFVADYGYPPNRDAFEWLVTTVFPRIRQQVPGAVLEIAGINLPSELACLGAECLGVDIRGYLEDLPAELDRADIVLCPLRIGGGVKVKVIEAIRRACLLVSTTVGGIGGIPEPLRSAVCFADDAETFAGHVVRLCANPHERRDRRQRLVDNQWAVPTWEDSSVRTMQLWSRLSARVSPVS